MITEQVRNQSFKDFKDVLGPRQREVLETLEWVGAGGATAWQLSEMLGRMIHAVRPRITELRKLGFVKAVGRRWYEPTKRDEAVFVAICKGNFDERGQGILI